MDIKYYTLSGYRRTARLLKAAAHPVRLAILELLLEGGEECVCHLEAALGYRQAYLSQHLMALREAGLVADRRDGRNIFYYVSQPEVVALLEHLRALQGGLEKKPHARPAGCICPKCKRVARAEASEKASLHR